MGLSRFFAAGFGFLLTHVPAGETLPKYARISPIALSRYIAIDEKIDAAFALARKLRFTWLTNVCYIAG
jgi:hypothetical protein